MNAYTNTRSKRGHTLTYFGIVGMSSTILPTALFSISSSVQLECSYFLAKSSGVWPFEDLALKLAPGAGMVVRNGDGGETATT